MGNAALKVAVIAGEVSGDLLAADLISSLKRRSDLPLQLVGVGGEGLEAQGLRSLFDFSELSIMGITQVLARLPRLVLRIRQTAAAVIAARPDILIIVDSPDFTHRVASLVRKALPDLPIVDYVCPSVWAWKEYRAQRMRAYTDHVLAVLPFEPDVMRRLGGPPTSYVGHRLATDPSLLETRRQRAARLPSGPDDERTILLLPGSRSSEINALLPVFGDAATALIERGHRVRFLLPTVRRQENLVRSLVKDWKIQPQVLVGQEEKWRAFAAADAAMAASGTVILELALAGVPVLSAYKTDWIIKLLHHRIKAWSAALPNLIADYNVVPEAINEMARPGNIARWMERLANDTIERRAMLEGFDLVWQRMQLPVPPGERAAEIVLDILATKKTGHF